ncbi:hypothetical protein [Massilia sp. LjRoot122]|uniref:hypothetical protein n=1 Tax=Massilia sp. LjRoot122 TaxID=3342257 RepID=UPI003ECDF892
MFWTPRPTLDTSSAPNLRRPETLTAEAFGPAAALDPPWASALPANGAAARPPAAAKKLRRPASDPFFVVDFDISSLFSKLRQLGTTLAKQATFLACKSGTNEVMSSAITT